MRVIFDLDNTLADTVGAIMAFYNQTSGQPPLDPDDQLTYHEVLSPAWLDTVHRFYETPQLYVDTVQPYPGALDAVEASRRAGDHVRILSGYRKADTTPRKAMWLEKWRPSLTDRLSGCRVGMKCTRSTDVDVNDHPDEILTRAQSYAQVMTVIVDQPYNRTVDMTTFATRRLVAATGRSAPVSTHHLYGWGELTIQLNTWRKVIDDA